MLYHWIEKYPEYLSKPHVRHYKQATAELKEQAIRRCLIDGEPVRSIAEDIGSCMLAAFDNVAVGKVLRLDPEELPLLCLSLGGKL